MNAFYFAHVSLLSPLLPLLLYLRARRISKELRLIRNLLIVGFVFDASSLFLALKGINTNPIANLFLLIQAVVLFEVFKIKLPGIRSLINAVEIAFAGLFTINYFFVQGYLVLNTYTVSISCIIFVFLSHYYFSHLLRSLPEFFVHRMPMIWINIAVLVYYSGNLFVFLFNDHFVMTTSWIIHNMLNITKNTLFAVAVWQNLRTTSSSS
jgi:hypothetical protein